jgi:hypothetical protein
MERAKKFSLATQNVNAESSPASRTREERVLKFITFISGFCTRAASFRISA